MCETIALFGYRGHKKVVWCLALYKQRLYSSGADNLIKVWDLDVLTNGCIKTMEGHTGVVSGRWWDTLGWGGKMGIEKIIRVTCSLHCTCNSQTGSD